MGIIVYATLSHTIDVRQYLPVVGLFTIVAERLAELGRKMFNKRLLVQNLWPSLDLVLNIINAPVQAEVVQQGLELQELQEDIVFENVSFAYHPDHPVLRNLNLVIPRGKMTALIGPSGCGKSTIADLLVRMYDIDSGRILLNGRSISDYSLASLRYRTGFVSQDTFIFNASVRENILVGNPAATEAEVHAAAHMAHCLEFIQKMPHKWDTIV